MRVVDARSGNPFCGARIDLRRSLLRKKYHLPARHRRVSTGFNQEAGTTWAIPTIRGLVRTQSAVAGFSPEGLRANGALIDISRSGTRPAPRTAPVTRRARRPRGLRSIADMWRKWRNNAEPTSTNMARPAKQTRQKTSIVPARKSSISFEVRARRAAAISVTRGLNRSTGIPWRVASRTCNIAGSVMGAPI